MRLPDGHLDRIQRFPQYRDDDHREDAPTLALLTVNCRKLDMKVRTVTKMVQLLSSIFHPKF